MNTQERTEVLQHLGFTIPDDSEIELRRTPWGQVTVLKNPDPAKLHRVSIDNPITYAEAFNAQRTRAGSTWEAYRNYAKYLDGDVLYMHPDYTLRIEGTYIGDDGSVTRYEVTDEGDQVSWSFSGSYPRRHVLTRSFVDLQHRRLFALNLLGAPGSGARAKFLTNFATMIREKGSMAGDHILLTAGARHREKLESLLGYNMHGAEQPDPTWVTVRPNIGGATVTGPQFVELRQKLKHFGQLVAKGEDPDELREELNTWAERDTTGYAGAFRHSIVRGWNDANTPDLTVCSCGHVEENGSITYGHGNTTICEACIDNGRYVIAEDTQAYHPASDVYQHGDGLYYTYDEHDEDDDDGYRYGIKGYTTDVRAFVKADTTIKSSAYGEFLMGIELEVDSTGYSRGKAATHTQQTLAPGYAILKNDGSLGENGFEIVTAPRGLKEHIERFKDWEPHDDLRAWDAGCCGMHVHISSKAFTQATLGKFIEFINAKQNDAFIRAIAGRHPGTDEQAKDYCQRDGCTPGNPKKTLCDKSSDRYFMVNTTNVTAEEARRLGLGTHHATGRSQNTIELRIFRASLKKARLLAQIEFTHAAVMFCRWSSMRELDGPHFLTWLQGLAGLYPNLAKWYGVKANTDKVEAQPKVRQGAEV
jgi:hypothetical protein